MSEWVKQELADWYDEVLYLEKITGNEFNKKYKCDIKVRIKFA